MRNGDINILFYKVMFCILLAVVFVLTFIKDAYAAKTNVSGVQNTINIVLAPQATSQPQTEVQLTVQPQQPEVQSTMTPEIQPTNTLEVQPTTEPKKDTIPQPENKPTQSDDELDKSPKTGDESDIISVAIVLAVSFIFMIISGAYIIRHRREV